MTATARWKGAHVVPAAPMTDRRDDFARLSVADTLEVARKALRSVGMRLAGTDATAHQTAKMLVYLAALLADRLAGKSDDPLRAELDALL